MPTVRIAARGLATFFRVHFGADPCTGSNIETCPGFRFNGVELAPKHIGCTLRQCDSVTQKPLGAPVESAESKRKATCCDQSMENLGRLGRQVDANSVSGNQCHAFRHAIPSHSCVSVPARISSNARSLAKDGIPDQAGASTGSTLALLPRARVPSDKHLPKSEHRRPAPC
jgi:hypothetical protein